MKGGTRQILEIVTRIQEEMATKDDIRRLESRVDNVEGRVAKNTEAVGRLSEQVEDVRGYSKEIDSLIDRVSVL